MSKIAVQFSYLAKYLTRTMMEDLFMIDFEPEPEPEVKKGIAEIGFNGFIYGYKARSFVDKIRQANRNPEVKGLMLSVDSPGGDVFDSIRIKSELEASNKPIGVFSSLLASGGIMITLPADFIIASGSLAEFGSIGAMFEYDATFLKEIKKHMRFIVSKTSPDKNREFLDLLDGDASKLIKQVDRDGRMFQAEVRKYRDLKGDVTKTLAGGMFKASSAQARGLIDGVGNYEFAMRKLGRMIKSA